MLCAYPMPFGDDAVDPRREITAQEFGSAV
jgi:hypothetical protein